jgi:hypothetical protein
MYCHGENNVSRNVQRVYRGTVVCTNWNSFGITRGASNSITVYESKQRTDTFPHATAEQPTVFYANNYPNAITDVTMRA